MKLAPETMNPDWISTDIDPTMALYLALGVIAIAGICLLYRIASNWKASKTQD